MRKVLAPFDGSASSLRAVQYLVDFSRSFGDLHVHLVNVQSEPRFYGNYVSPDMLEQLHAGALDHAAELNAKAAALLQEAGIKYDTHEVMGEVVSEILNLCRQHHCDTIVMGTRGQSGLKNLVMGSVASHVVHGAEVPVLLVK